MASLRKQIKDAVKAACAAINLGTTEAPINPGVTVASDQPGERPTINIWPPSSRHVEFKAPRASVRSLVFVIEGHADYEDDDDETATRDEKVDNFIKIFDKKMLEDVGIRNLSTQVIVQEIEEINIPDNSLIFLAEVTIRYQYKSTDPDTAV